MIVSKGRATLLATVAAGLLALQAVPARAEQFQVTNLVSDGFVPAVTIDPALVNPWGMSSSPTGPFWVSDNGTGVSTLYNGAGIKQGLTVTVPPASGSAPTGQVFNGLAHPFQVTSGGKTGAAVFIFATEDGTISGWAPSVDGTNAVIAVDNSSEQAVYKGLAIGHTGHANFLYAANFHSGDVEMYNNRFQLVKVLRDPTIPAGYAPFNVQNLNDTLYVTFALQDADKEDDVAGAGHGYVDAFSLDGSFLRRVASAGRLNSPWGLDIAPAGFGSLAGALLVGNFGNGQINAYDPVTGAYKGKLLGAGGDPIVLGDLWGLINGNGGSAGDANKVYFTAGIKNEAHGLFGSLSVIP
ncbi:MAG: TIGR03118 family protein [Caulobacteraceae bacterium]|nr:TIGR03118 family protein [Caulobacteraceae bacterium]